MLSVLVWLGIVLILLFVWIEVVLVVVWWVGVIDWFEIVEGCVCDLCFKLECGGIDVFFGDVG